MTSACGPVEDGKVELPASCCPSRADAGSASGRDASERDASTRDGAADSAAATNSDAQPPEDDDGCPASAGLTQICLYVEAADLDELHRNPHARVEVPAEVSINGVYYPRAEIEVHGGSSRSYDKLSYRLKFEDASDTQTDFFGDGPQATKRIVLQASWIDPTWSRAKLAMDLTRELGGLAPRIGHAEVTLNGQYHGLYLAIERIDTHYLRRAQLNPRGDLFKAESNHATWQVHGNPMKGFDRQTNKEKTDNNLGEFFQKLDQARSALEDFERDLSPLLSFEDFEIWHAVMTFADNRDTFRKNYYLYHDPDATEGTPEARWRIIQWDADATFGQNWDGEPRSADSTHYYGSSNVFAARYFAIPELRSAYLLRYAEWLKSAFSVDALEPKVNQLQEELKAAIDRDLEHWARKIDAQAEFERLLEAVLLRHHVMSERVAELSEGAAEDASPAEELGDDGSGSGS